MRIVLFSSVVIGVMVLLASCISTPEPKEELFYTLSAPDVPLEHGDGPALVVEEFSAAPGYDTTQIVYRQAANEIRYWGYRDWVTTAPRLITATTIRHLRASGLFSAVDSGHDRVRPHAIVVGHVAAIEEIDHEEYSEARLAMVFQLRDPDSDKVLLRHAFDLKRPCEAPHPQAVAKAVGEILADQIANLGQQIVGALKKPPATTNP